MNRPDPLTPEERELARLLGRPASSAPPTSLDAAVLAAARAAVQPVEGAAPTADPAQAAPASPPSSAAPRRRSRLPAVFGLAASLVFAVGIAWQLKPDAPPPAAPVPVATETAPASSAPEARAVAGDAAQAPAPADRPAAAAPEPAPVKPMPVPVPAPPPPAQRAEAAPAVAPAPPVPMAAPTLQDVPATPRAQGAPGVMRRAEPAPAAAYGAMVSPDALTLAVDADAALPRRQWIKRIRERRDAGDLDTARASLERYLQHYPEARIPGDLRALLDP